MAVVGNARAERIEPPTFRRITSYRAAVEEDRARNADEVVTVRVRDRSRLLSMVNTAVVGRVHVLQRRNTSGGAL